MPYITFINISQLIFLFQQTLRSPTQTSTLNHKKWVKGFQMVQMVQTVLQMIKVKPVKIPSTHPIRRTKINLWDTQDHSITVSKKPRIARDRTILGSIKMPGKTHLFIKLY